MLEPLHELDDFATSKTVVVRPAWGSGGIFLFRIHIFFDFSPLHLPFTYHLFNNVSHLLELQEVSLRVLGFCEVPWLCEHTVQVFLEDFFFFSASVGISDKVRRHKRFWL